MRASSFCIVHSSLNNTLYKTQTHSNDISSISKHGRNYQSFHYYAHPPPDDTVEPSTIPAGKPHLVATPIFRTEVFNQSIAMEESHSTQPDRRRLSADVDVPGIISRQATINIGIIGHVAHGKRTLVRAISGINAMRNNSKQALSKTIKLGYANAKTYTCDCEDCPRPTCYTSAGSEGTGSFECNRDEFKDMYRLIHHVSFVYCLGHEIYMSTMLNGAAVMDAAILLIGANEPCPQPQTSEHLAAIEILKLGGVVVVQNKVDTISLEAAFTHNEPICRFTHDTVAGKSISIPTSTTFRWNLDAALERIAHIRPPDHNLTAPPTMDVVRSFDISRPGCQIEKLRGGITGYSHTGHSPRRRQYRNLSRSLLSNQREAQLDTPLFPHRVSSN